MHTSEALKDLNEAQKEAVLITAGPLLILAGAGSGKTKTLTHRIAYMITDCGMDPSAILAVTFTNKAAREMRERVESLVGGRSPSNIGTFHSICARILRREIDNLGYSRSFVIYDESDSLGLIKQIMGDMGIDEKKVPPQTVRSLISSAKNELIYPAKYRQMAHGFIQEQAAHIFAEYQKQLHAGNAVDFDDLIGLVVRLWQEHPEILKKYQNLWQQVMVDEYQDTNTAQYTFINLLTAQHHNLCVVGDDWQSIYSWRGANYQNILNFERDYPDVKTIKLEQNYRSTKTILDAAHQVITKNINRSDKKLWTDNDSGNVIVIQEVFNEAEEARFALRETDGLIRRREAGLSDVAILYRTNAMSRSVEEACLRMGLPYKIIGGIRFYERKEIKDMLAFLRFIYQPEWMCFKRIVNLPPRGIGQKSLELLYRELQKSGNLRQTLLDPVKISGLTPKAQAGLADLMRIIEKLRKQIDTKPLHEFIASVYEQTGYRELINDGTEVGMDRDQNVQELFSVAEKMEDQKGMDALEQFLEDVALVSDLDSYSESAEAITLMTLHSAKGLEFPVVFMFGMEENIFPHSMSMLDPAEIEEERRLCYVGMTRAKKRLYLSYTMSRMLYGKVQANPPSRFLSDIPEALTSRGQNNEVRHQPKGSNGLGISEGDRVKHESFGTGVVNYVDGDEIQITFEAAGKKILSLSYAPLQKL